VNETANAATHAHHSCRFSGYLIWMRLRVADSAFGIRIVITPSL